LDGPGIVIVTVVWAARDVQDLVLVEVERGATLADAVRASGLIPRYALDPQRLRYAIYGRRTEGDALLAAGDRVEILGPLNVDPKAARVRRAKAGPKRASRRGER
jgi:putative ubiquitin-RnfH superfamily antitoxin RatB of RatAB toxin-antitoxin module